MLLFFNVFDLINIVKIFISKHNQSQKAHHLILIFFLHNKNDQENNRPGYENVQNRTKLLNVLIKINKLWIPYF